MAPAKLERHGCTRAFLGGPSGTEDGVECARQIVGVAGFGVRLQSLHEGIYGDGWRVSGCYNPAHVFAAPDQHKDGVQEAERIQSRGHTQPDDAHFSHGAVRYSESMLTVYPVGRAILPAAAF